MNTMKRAAAYLAIITAGVVLGIASGRLYSNWKIEAAISEKQNVVREALFNSLQGIEIGNEFPEVIVWTVDESETVTIDDILPAGGILYFIAADCYWCKDALIGLKGALASEGSSHFPVAIVAQGSPDVVRVLESELGMKIFVDIQQTLSRDFGVVTFPTCFLIDRDHKLQLIETDVRTTEQVLEIMDDYAG